MEWLPIILSFLQPFLAKCFAQQSTESPKEYLTSLYNASNGKMDSDLVIDAMSQTRRAIRKARRNASREDRRNFPRYSRDEIYDITERQLIEAMNAPPEQLAAVFASAAALSDDD